MIGSWKNLGKNNLKWILLECYKNEQIGFSREDHKFIVMATASLKLVEGHYSIGLSLRNKDVCMPDNKIIAEVCSEPKEKTEKYILYNLISLNTLFLKVMQKVPAKYLKRSDGKVWYILYPIMVFIFPKGKLCVIFDCGATFQDTSYRVQTSLVH